MTVPTCESCRRDVPAGAKFCPECGHPQARRCPACLHEVAAGAKFCPECGTRLDAAQEMSRPAADAGPDREQTAADRRFVSVLFGDIVAYTAFAEGRDPDEVRDLLTEYFDRSRAIIEKYGGVVEKFIGDAIFGVWGTDRVREDDAERAVRAALELVSMMTTLGDEQGHDGLQLRAGVMSGSTMVGPGGNESTGMIVGDLVNTAARLQSKAEPDTVYVGRSTRDVTADAIAYEPRGEVLVKGKAEPVEVWRALRPTGRVGSGPNVRELPFVGREREMRLLTDWLDATSTEGRARLVSVTGEAGIGKSRLAKEFLHQVDGYADDVYWHQGRSPSYGDGVPMWSLIEMVRQRAGIAGDGEDSRARTRLRTMLAEYVDDAGDRSWIEGWLAGLLGVADLPAGSRAELLSALRSFFQHIARRGPTVLVFEDLHWADDAVVEFITELIDRSTRAPILVIALARPELLDRHPAFGSQHRASIHVALGALSDDDMRATVSEYLEGRAPDLVERIVDRAAGYPLYAAEILRMLLNDGSLVATDDRFEWRGDSGALSIPDTLHAVIGARLDRLDRHHLTVLQDAAVLGLSFRAEALRAFDDRDADEIEESLRRLVRLDILEIVDDPRSPERGQYRFVQGLIQELAYDRLNRAERRARHLAAADHFARDDDPELAGIVAKHLQGAYESSPEGPDREALVQRAIDSLVGAARHSAALHADRVAIDLYDRAIELAGDHERVADWCLEAYACALADGSPDRALGYTDLARSRFAAVDDSRGRQRAALARADVYNGSYRAGDALEVIEPLYLELDSIDDELSLQIAAQTVRAYALTLRSAEAIAAADRALPAAEAAEETAIVVDLLISRATAIAFDGRTIEGVAGLVGSHEIAQREGLVAAGTRALNNLHATVIETGPRSAKKWAEQSLALAHRSGVREWIIRAEMSNGVGPMWDGELDAAQRFLERAEEHPLDLHYTRWVEWARSMIDARRGAPGWEARFAEAVAPFESTSDVQVAHGVHAAWALCHALRAEWSDAYERAIAAGPHEPSSGALAAHAVVRLEGPRLLPAVVGLVAAMSPGPLRSAYRELVEAVSLVFEGDRQAGALRFERAIRTLEEVALGETIALTKVTYVAALGVEHPGALRAGEEARDWFDDHGLRGFGLVLDDLVPLRGDDSARAAS